MHCVLFAKQRVGMHVRGHVQTISHWTIKRMQRVHLGWGWSLHTLSLGLVECWQVWFEAYFDSITVMYSTCASAHTHTHTL